MEARLVVVRGRPRGKRISLQEGEFLIGRGKECKLRPNSELVSRHHCCFTFDDEGLRVREMGSTNGTFVNGKRIKDEVSVINGDLVSVGPLTFAVIIPGSRPIEDADQEATAAPTIGAEDIASDNELADWLDESEVKSAPADGGSGTSGRTLVLDKHDVPETPEEDLTMAQNGEDDENTARERAKQETRVLPTDDEKSTADAAGELMRKYFQRPNR